MCVCTCGVEKLSYSLAFDLSSSLLNIRPTQPHPQPHLHPYSRSCPIPAPTFAHPHLDPPPQLFQRTWAAVRTSAIFWGGPAAQAFFSRRAEVTIITICAPSSSCWRTTTARLLGVQEESDLRLTHCENCNSTISQVTNRRYILQHAPRPAPPAELGPSHWFLPWRSAP